MKFCIKKFLIFFLVFASFYIEDTKAQNNLITGADSSRRVITTAVPFLNITPDSRSGAMGDAGVATNPTANAIHWNAGKLAFLEKDMGFSLSYIPWLAKVINDMSISYLTGYKKITREQTVGMELRYFDLGDIQLTDENGEPLGSFNPREFSVAGTYSRMLSSNFGLGITGRFIHSNLSGDVTSVNTGDVRAGITAAADIGAYYHKDISLNGKPANMALGANISNIGAKISYISEENADFIPTNLRLGGALTNHLDSYNSITFALDMNKLMVPSPPVYKRDDNNRIVTDDNGDPEIQSGNDPDRSLLSGMFGSFADAPDGINEELKEIMWSFGMEYWYNDLFAVRAGYYHENKDKGSNRYITAGFGLRYQVFGVDFSYLVPRDNEHPLAETIRISMSFNLERETDESITEDEEN